MNKEHFLKKSEKCSLAYLDITVPIILEFRDYISKIEQKITGHYPEKFESLNHELFYQVTWLQNIYLNYSKGYYPAKDRMKMTKYLKDVFKNLKDTQEKYNKSHKLRVGVHFTLWMFIELKTPKEYGHFIHGNHEFFYEIFKSFSDELAPELYQLYHQVKNDLTMLTKKVN
ncbi:hypothetical protein Q4Q35_19580 [Flavivirga aquimarina]|uniref:Globin n=1 Tax=Flavivirga aquimarina TaxID=2027862 RepID=A0ABT8WG27_9FLAO|nr:hypothetical protein [Flavivirga aquimarina]MDO5972008.1 hypothetical protein [Flavivirga aquimarina]